MKDILNTLKSLPENPGVYFLKDKDDVILYIGKAKNLKKRVSSYFNKSNKNSKNIIMISKVLDIETHIVRDEVEALITESNMIKVHKPRYNVFLKDDKTFPYITITKEPFPRVEIIRKKNLRKDGNIYFGPYTDVKYLRSVVKVLHQIFPLRTCSYFIDDDVIIREKIKVCLDYHINKCEGPCEGLVSEDKYNNMIKQVISFLKGKNKYVKTYLLTSMKEASRYQRYEEAARLRDQLMSLKEFEKKQTKITQEFVDRDIINISYKDNYALGLIMRIRNGLLSGREKFHLKIINHFDIEIELEQFIIQYYELTMDIPNEIIIAHNIQNESSIIKWIKHKNDKRVSIIIPQRGDRKHMLDLCIKNNDLLLRDILIKKIKRQEYIPKTLSQLQEDLNMPAPPKHIEAFDNSNIQGEHAVAGMVCFINGKPSKKDYRYFNIKTVKGIDDFKSMREVVFRRYSKVLKDKKKFPDLILIDGGKGQLSAAKSSLDKLGLGYIAVIGLAKKLEEVFVPESLKPQNISKTSPSLYLLQKIRDEVHRYSINFHRRKRDSNLFDSILSNVKGLGKKRIKLIWKNYNSFDEIIKDSLENININTGIPVNIIELVKSEIKQFKKDSNE